MMLQIINYLALSTIFMCCMVAILHPKVKFHKMYDFALFALACTTLGALVTDSGVAWVLFDSFVAVVAVVMLYRQLKRSKRNIHI